MIRQLVSVSVFTAFSASRVCRVCDSRRGADVGCLHGGIPAAQPFRATLPGCLQRGLLPRFAAAAANQTPPRNLAARFADDVFAWRSASSRSWCSRSRYAPIISVLAPGFTGNPDHAARDRAFANHLSIFCARHRGAVPLAMLDAIWKVSAAAASPILKSHDQPWGLRVSFPNAAYAAAYGAIAGFAARLYVWAAMRAGLQLRLALLTVSGISSARSVPPLSAQARSKSGSFSIR